MECKRYHRRAARARHPGQPQSLFAQSCQHGGRGSVRLHLGGRASRVTRGGPRCRTIERGSSLMAKFTKGQSGNPGRRHKGVAEVQEAARKHTTEAVRDLVTIGRSKKLPAQARVAAWNSVLDRAYGKPPQSMDLKAKGDLIVKILKFSDEAKKK